MKEKDRSLLSRLREWASGPPTQASLFRYVKDEPESSVWPDFWNLLRHPIQSIREERQAPHTRASLFNYVERPEDSTPLDWKDLLKDLFTGYRFALFIPSLWSNQEELAEERSELRTRKMEAGVASLVIHGLIVGLAVFLALYKPTGPLPQKDPMVMITTAMNLPFEGDGRDGGGGGGGGKHELDPPMKGRMPETTRVQFMPPDPGQPKPLLPSDNPLDVKASVQMPIDLPTDSSLPIGDITAPPGDTISSGSGSEGGIGTGRGPGIGPGTGPGYGPGEDGGYGGGRHGGIGDGDGPHVAGNDVTAPEAIYKPLPAYTEEARKNRTEGIVRLQVIVTKRGSVEGIRVVQGLGYGLDESAISTIATKWRFKPGTLHGIPVDVRAVIEITFRLY